MKICCEDGGPMGAGCYHDRCMGAIESGKVTITEKEWEIYQRLKKIWEHASPRPDTFFICGEGGERDGMGLPEHILVCPGPGSDGMAMYTMSKPYSAPEW